MGSMLISMNVDGGGEQRCQKDIDRVSWVNDMRIDAILNTELV